MHIEINADGQLVRVTPGAGTLTLPGVINAHSHAFQRALRGRVETRSVDRSHDDFWSWRETMYADSARLDTDDVAALARWAYADMLQAGYVAVAEFHYLHHASAGAHHQRAELSVALAEAARAVGIRLLLLETAYLRGGFDRPLMREQQRFSFDNVAAFLAHARRAQERVLPLGARTGLAIHSVRACARADIEAVARAASDQGLPLHVHACEQRREVADCKKEHGLTPIALLAAAGALTARTTVVHATHLDDDDVGLLAKSQATVCLTPSTERNLGDGLGRIADLHAAGVPLCVGSDSHARIDAVSELRSVEDHERLRLERRNVLVPPGGRLAHALVPIGTRNGARALGFDVKSNVTVRLGPEAHAKDPAAGVDAWLVGGAARDVTDVEIDGAPVVRQGALVRVDRARIDADARAVLIKLSA